MESVLYDVEAGLDDPKDLSVTAGSFRRKTISLDGGGIQRTLSRAFLSAGMPVTFKVSHISFILIQKYPGHGLTYPSSLLPSFLLPNSLTYCPDCRM
jgi:hypothetical protein